MIAYENLSDQELFELLNQSDDKAYKEIYDRYWGPLYSRIKAMATDPEEAKDILQEVFLNLYNKRGTFKSTDSLRGYLFTMVRSSTFNLKRHYKVTQKYLKYLTQTLSEGTSAFQGPDLKLVQKEFAEQIEIEIANLPPRMRQIFEMAKKGHKTHQEIALKLGISKGTVKKQMYYAIQKLKSKLSSFFFLIIMLLILVSNKLLN